MTDLAAWLTQIWDEEGRLAKRAGDALTTPEIDNYGHLTVPSGWMLARIAADRKILAIHSVVHEHITFVGGESGDDWCDTCGSVDDRPIAWPCPTLRLLALPYADRPGYREEWRPE